MNQHELKAASVQYYIYIKRTHCTIEQAAAHFNVPKTTLFKRLSHLTTIQRADLHQIAYENRLRQQLLVFHIPSFVHSSHSNKAIRY